MGYDKYTINPVEYLRNVHQMQLPEYITYEPAHKGQYEIRRQHAHDGTLAITYMLIDEILNLVLEKKSYYKPEEPVWGQVSSVKYIIGDIQIEPFKAEPKGDKWWATWGEKIILPVTCMLTYDEPATDKGE